MEFLKEYVCKGNIILAQINYDKDIHHLQAYFLPVVNEVKKIRLLEPPKKILKI